MKQYATQCIGNIVRAGEEADVLGFKECIPLVFKVYFIIKIGNFKLQ